MLVYELVEPPLVVIHERILQRKRLLNFSDDIAKIVWNYTELKNQLLDLSLEARQIGKELLLPGVVEVVVGLQSSAAYPGWNINPDSFSLLKWERLESDINFFVTAYGICVTLKCHELPHLLSKLSALHLI